MSKYTTKRKIIEVTNAEEPANNKKPKIEEGDEWADRSVVFASLPLEILSQHILKFFDFIQWLKLVIVSKQWQLAAQQSHLPKQFIFDKSVSDAKPNLEFACTILRKYSVNTLVIVQEQGRTMLFSQLQTLLNSSRAITTLVLDQCYTFQDDVSVNFEQIRTLSTTRTWILPHFPQVEKLKLSTHALFKDGLLYDAGNKIKIDFQIPSVKEIEINVSTLEFDYANVTKYFPNVNKMYVNYDHVDSTKQQAEEDWKRLEDTGKALGVQIICRNPHLSERADVFSLTSITYHEYFNAFGETPLQNLLSYIENYPKKCQELFVSYSSRQYEKDLLRREPQFNFPLRSPAFNPYCMKACIESDKLRIAMVECGYMDYWKALGQMNPKQAARTKLLRDSSQHLPPTKNTIESISKLIESNMSAVTIVDMIGLETFKEITKMTSKDGTTLLLKVAGKIGASGLDLIIEHSDVHALNKDGMNAATIAFNLSHTSSWLKLVDAGCQVQSNLYSMEQPSIFFLRQVINSTSNDQIRKVLLLFEQTYLQKAMRILAGREAANNIYPSTKSIYPQTKPDQILEDLIHLGARPHDHDDGQDPLISLMAESYQIKLFWPIIEKYQLNINALNKDGYTPLMTSIQWGFFDQAELLLEEGADPNIHGTSNFKMHVVFMEEVIGQPSFIDLLQTYGADWTVEDDQGNTVLNYAMLNCSSACIKKLAKLVPIDKPNHNNCTPLYNAICEQQVRFVGALIEAGADVHVLAGPLLQPALMTAIELSSVEVISVLLTKAKHDITIRDRIGRSIVHYLLLTHDPKKVQHLNSSLKTNDIELIKQHYNTPESISFLKNELATVFANPDLEHLKSRVLSIAIRSFMITSTLIDVLGMDVNMEDSNGDTMLHLLNVDKTPEELVDYLLSKPSLNLNHQNKQKNTALMIVTEKKKTDAEFESWQLKLIKAGASLTIKNMWGLSPIDIEPSLKQYVK